LRLTIKGAAHTTISAPTIGIIPSATSKALLSLRSMKKLSAGCFQGG